MFAKLFMKGESVSSLSIPNIAVVCCTVHSEHRLHVCSAHKALVRLGRVSPRVWRFVGKTIGFDGNVDNILIKSRIVLTSAAPGDWRPQLFTQFLRQPVIVRLQLPQPGPGHTRRTLARQCRTAKPYVSKRKLSQYLEKATTDALGCLSDGWFASSKNPYSDSDS